MREAVVASLGPLAHVEGTRGEVVAVFPSAAYVTDGRGRLAVVHATAHGHTPTSVLVDGARPAAWGVQPGDAVTGRAGRLRVGPLVLDARQARQWQPRPAPRLRPTATVGVVLLEAAGPASTRLAPPCAALSSALDLDDAGAIAAALDALVGAGPGLTPSGDDALVGLLAVLHRVATPRQGAAARARLRALVPPRLARTTAISAHYVALALDGHLGEHLTNLVDGLAGTVDHALVPAVLATGATSGADALVGVAAGLTLLSHRPPLELEDVA